jgi:hypothetical protein
MPAARKSLFRMMGGGAAAALCPTGFHCMDTGTILFGVLVVLALAAIIVFVLKQNGLLEFGALQKPTIVVMPSHQPAAPQNIFLQREADPRFAPRSPERSYNQIPDLRGGGALATIPINAQTRGYPDAYQQVGLLTAEGGTDNSASPTRTILPLFGRSVDSARNRWNYYTRTDGMNPVQVPVQFKRRNCDDDNGCEEVNDGEAISVPALGQAFTATMYRYSTPRYTPTI